MLLTWPPPPSLLPVPESGWRREEGKKIYMEKWNIMWAWREREVGLHRVAAREWASERWCNGTFEFAQTLPMNRLHYLQMAKSDSTSFPISIWLLKCRRCRRCSSDAQSATICQIGAVTVQVCVRERNLLENWKWFSRFFFFFFNPAPPENPVR